MVRYMIWYSALICLPPWSKMNGYWGCIFGDLEIWNEFRVEQKFGQNEHCPEKALFFPRLRKKNTEIKVWSRFGSDLALPNIPLFEHLNRKMNYGRQPLSAWHKSSICLHVQISSSKFLVWKRFLETIFGNNFWKQFFEMIWNPLFGRVYLNFLP